MPDAPLTDQQLEAYAAIAARAADDPFFLSDCEGSLQVWHEKALVRVTRDDTGAITSYSFPFAYQPANQVVEIDLDTWDPGEDATDDQRRQDISTSSTPAPAWASWSLRCADFRPNSPPPARRPRHAPEQLSAPARRGRGNAPADPREANQLRPLAPGAAL